MLDEGTNNSFNILDMQINLLHDIKIEQIPIDPFRVIMRNHWLACPYAVFSDLLVMEPDDMKIHISNHSFSTFSTTKGTYILVYNEEQSEEEIRFNLAHEIGHIYLKHITPEFTFIENLPKCEKLVRECQADKFAEFVLGRI